MATNAYFHPRQSEKTLYEDLIIESIKIYGLDVYYLPREIVKRDTILNEDIESQFNESHIIEMYVENTDSYTGDGDLFQKFGMEIRDEVTFVLAKRTWQTTVDDVSTLVDGIPKEGDLIYLPMTGALFEVNFVENEAPFYQLNNLTMFKLECALFEESGENFDTGVEAIDKFETEYGFSIPLTVSDWDILPVIGTRYYQNLGNDVTVSGEIASIDGTTIRLGSIQTSDMNYHDFKVSTDYTNYLLMDIADDTVNRIKIDVVQGLDVLGNDGGAQNKAFTDEEVIIDFSESDPFGEAF